MTIACDYITAVMQAGFVTQTTLLHLRLSEQGECHSGCDVDAGLDMICCTKLIKEGFNCSVLNGDVFLDTTVCDFDYCKRSFQHFLEHEFAVLQMETQFWFLSPSWKWAFVSNNVCTLSKYIITGNRNTILTREY